jgi:hypothetical protein
MTMYLIRRCSYGTNHTHVSRLGPKNAVIEFIIAYNAKARTGGKRLIEVGEYLDIKEREGGDWETFKYSGK